MFTVSCISEEILTCSNVDMICLNYNINDSFCSVFFCINTHFELFPVDLNIWQISEDELSCIECPTH